MKYTEDDVYIDQRLTGFSFGLCPFATNTSSGRGKMFSRHLNQPVIIEGAEFPQFFSGKEEDWGKFELNESRRDQDIRILAVIPKYRVLSGNHHIKEPPQTTVIYQGMDDRKVGCFDIFTYTQGANGFGYMNKLMNSNLLYKDQVVSKETQFQTSPIHQDREYRYGLNLNVAYSNDIGTTEDAMVISESAAKKMTTTDIHTLDFMIDENQLPQNTYGDDDFVRFFPDIGMTVRPDGIVCAIRTPDMGTIISDTYGSSGYTPNMHDQIIRDYPGAVVLDIDVNCSRQIKQDHPVFEQARQYHANALEYYMKIYRTYIEYKDTYKLTPEMNTRVTDAIKRLVAAGHRIRGVEPRSRLSMSIGDKPIRFIHIKLTMMHRRFCNKGFKITGREGSKGVIGEIRPDSDMPVDDHGIRADLIIDFASVPHRMNFGQLNEGTLNRTAEFVRRKMESMALLGDYPGAWKLLIEFLNDINPKYAQLVAEKRNTPDKQRLLLDEWIANRIVIHHPPGLKTTTSENVVRIVEKYGSHPTPVNYVVRDRETGEVKHCRTKTPVEIGSKYVMLLMKIPKQQASGAAYTSQYGIPHKPPGQEAHASLIRRKALRLGEDENRMMHKALSGLYPDEAPRFMQLMSNSPVGVKKMYETILNADNPVKIKRVNISTEDLMRTSTILSQVHHTFETLGIGSLHTAVKYDPKDLDKLHEL